MVYTDGAVHADVQISDDAILILSFSSNSPRKGCGRRAVRWLQANFNTVCVQDPGINSSMKSFMFWKAMANENLVSEIEDENNVVIFANGSWTIPDCGSLH